MKTIYPFSPYKTSTWRNWSNYLFWLNNSINSLEDYLNYVCYILTHISPSIVIHRVSGDAPKDLLLAPNWNLHKKWILNGLEKKLKEENLWQGKYYISR